MNPYLFPTKMSQFALGKLRYAALATAFSLPLFGGTVTLGETVSGLDGPWEYVSGGLNTNYQYGVDDQAAPVVLNAASGLSFAAGGQFTITYQSGLVSAGSGFPAVDANGYSGFIFNNGPGNSGQVAPSAYMNPATYPIYLVELVGTFTDSTGAIVGTPFAIGDGPFTVTVPAGAADLQLGVNDDIYYDNTGSFLVDVTGPQMNATPEPASFLLVAFAALLGLALPGTRKRLLGR